MMLHKNAVNSEGKSTNESKTQQFYIHYVILQLFGKGRTGVTIFMLIGRNGRKEEIWN